MPPSDGACRLDPHEHVYSVLGSRFVLEGGERGQTLLSNIRNAAEVARKE